MLVVGIRSRAQLLFLGSTNTCAKNEYLWQTIIDKDKVQIMRREKTLIEGRGLTACLEKLKISEARYTKEFGSLRSKGYSEIEAQTVILRKFSKKTVKTLLALHDALIAQEFTHAELVKITGHDGGSLRIGKPLV
ncbi:MAG: hypothetical protein A3F46_02000 [Legionellales bacterium RIFCSPHIGHO2_12_FULL_42_9]|nr:MAG: hypothetical protein A3F46_02000 [Legionellales bacterium RIFCSPHIGHO2_12_FULL_42_9]